LTTRILVFAKAPVPGEVKTRLIPALGAAGAAALHERLVGQTLATAAAAATGPVELCCAPDVSHPVLAAFARAHGATLAAQGPGDLGDRMHAAFERALAGAPAAIVIGCDCPALTPHHLREAAAALAGGDDAVLAPAADGGYVLIGLARVARTLFDRICWGGPHVLEDTRRRLAALGWRWRELATLWDVDRPEDLMRLRREIADGAALVDGLRR
jgi:rSAM/selenodomain-associated transferase 1